MTTSALYIHIPFCHSKCGYCDFFSVPRRRLTDGFMDALCNELRVRAGEWPYPFETVYIGGGTPSSLSQEQLDRLLDAIPGGSFREFTIEVNPDDITPDRAARLADSPIDRVSMGIQTFSDQLLRLIGRRHDAAGAVRAFDTLRGAGFDNISCDLIYGLPGQTLDDWTLSLRRLIAMRPEHISSYLLSYEPGTRFHAMLQAGKLTECDPDLAGEMYDRLVAETRQAGYVHYEISNFALPGREAVHNSRYWDFTPYLGIGPGAHGFDGERRFYNRSDLAGYIAGHGLESREVEEETTDNRFNDLVMTSLRTARGLSPDEVATRFGHRYLDLVDRASRPHLATGVMRRENGRLVIDESRWLESNDIIIDFLAVE